MGSTMPTDMGISVQHKHAVNRRKVLPIKFLFKLKMEREINGHICVRILVTDVEEAVAWTIPLPALQLLVLRVLQPAVMEHHSHNALQTDTHIWC